jgi:hypothetical protein
MWTCECGRIQEDPSCVSRCNEVKYLSWHIGIVCFPTNRRFVNVVLTAVGADTVPTVTDSELRVRVHMRSKRELLNLPHKVHDKARMFVCLCTCTYWYIGLYVACIYYMYIHVCLYVCVYVYTHTLEFERGNTRLLLVENSGLVVRQSTQLINVWIDENIPDSSIWPQSKVCLDDWL